MNPEIKQRWIAALRSGEIKQAKGNLRTDEGMCCLGVLCNLYDPKGWVGYRFRERHTILPEVVRDWAALDSQNPRIGRLGLTEYNDGVRDGARMVLPQHSFPEIADLIEANL